MSAVAAHSPDKQEFSQEWVQEATRAATLEAILADVPVASEKVEVRIKPGFVTACWAYLPPHRVYIGDGIPKKAREGLSEKEHIRYLANYVFHEFAHALWTARNLKAIHEDLKGLAPFSLFNLFEDARIEDLYRTTYGHAFEWTQFEDVSVNLEDPRSLLFAFIQHEGDARAVGEVAEAATIPQALVDEVAVFYRRAVDAKTSQQLYPILTDWIARFGAPPEGIPKGLEDLSLSLVLQENPEALEAFEEDTMPINGKPSVQVHVKGRSAESVAVDQTEGNAQLLGEEEFELQPERTRRLAKQLERLFASESRQVSTEVPSKRISVRNFIAGRPCYRRAEIRSRTRRKVLLVVDCSGSMEGYHIQEGRPLVPALSELARRGIVSGHVVLSCVLEDQASRRSKGPTKFKSCWQRFSLPMQDSSIRRIDAYGCAEGLEFSIYENLRQAQQADYVLVLNSKEILRV